MMITGSFKLREAERTAKQGRLGLWRNYVPPAGSATKQSGVFKGTVMEVRVPQWLSVTMTNAEPRALYWSHQHRWHPVDIVHTEAASSDVPPGDAELCTAHS